MSERPKVFNFPNADDRARWAEQKQRTPPEEPATPIELRPELDLKKLNDVKRITEEDRAMGYGYLWNDLIIGKARAELSPLPYNELLRRLNACTEAEVRAQPAYYWVLAECIEAHRESVEKDD